MVLIEFSVAMMLLMLAWRAWRLSVIDHGRDVLFDLRDCELRPEFMKEAISQDEYEQLRRRINEAIHYLDRASLPQLIWMSGHHQELRRIREQKLRLRKGDPQLSQFGRAFMQKVASKVITHTVLASATGCVVLVPFLVRDLARRGVQAILKRDMVSARPVAAAAMSVLLVLSSQTATQSASGSRKSKNDFACVIVEEVAHAAI